MSWQAKDKHLSFEFFPPKNDKGEQRFQKTMSKLERYPAKFCSVTFGAGGSTRERTLHYVDWIRRNTRFDSVPHLSCIGSRKEDLRAFLQRYRDLGIRRVMALRGDIPEDEEAFKEGGFRYGNELVAFIREEFPEFEINVGCYPEFHPETPDPEKDIDNFVRKVQAGADRAVTQYFFNNACYYKFVEDVRKRGVDVPIVPGLMPIANFEQIDRFSSMCGADIPRWIRLRMEAFGDDTKAQRELGIEIATRQAEELLEQGAPGLHIYTLNRYVPASRVWENLGLPVDEEYVHDEEGGDAAAPPSG